ncbi:hypothetical protein BDV18DRAFT_159995 [Aspergillus unguis]
MIHLSLRTLSVGSLILLTLSVTTLSLPTSSGPSLDIGITDFMAPVPLDHLPGMFSQVKFSEPAKLPTETTKTPSPEPSLTSTQITDISNTIRNTLALYPLAIDGKNFTALSSIFAPAATANYSAPLNVLAPLSGIQSALANSLACVSTQHSLGTQAIDVLSGRYARSVTYYTASHFGISPGMKSQVATAHGQYQDLWERVDFDERGVRTGGVWRVVHRNLVYMSEVMGNQEVFVC